MSISNYLRRFEYIHWLINQQATGDCNEFANKLGLCKRQLLNTLADLRAMGAPIAYSKTNNCYYYTHEWHPFTGLAPKDLNAVKGGKGFFKTSYYFATQAISKWGNKYNLMEIKTNQSFINTL